jgi:hypothetical protein
MRELVGDAKYFLGPVEFCPFKTPSLVSDDTFCPLRDRVARAVGVMPRTFLGLLPDVSGLAAPLTLHAFCACRTALRQLVGDAEYFLGPSNLSHF